MEPISSKCHRAFSPGLGFQLGFVMLQASLLDCKHKSSVLFNRLQHSSLGSRCSEKDQEARNTKTLTKERYDSGFNWRIRRGSFLGYGTQCTIEEFWPFRRNYVRNLYRSYDVFLILILTTSRYLAGTLSKGSNLPWIGNRIHFWARVGIDVQDRGYSRASEDRELVDHSSRGPTGEVNTHSCQTGYNYNSQ